MWRGPQLLCLTFSPKANLIPAGASWTFITSGTTLGALIALLILGGPIIRPFAWVMTFGVITGTFSSIFIASPVLWAVERRWPGEDVRGVRTIAPKGAPAAT